MGLLRCHDHMVRTHGKSVKPCSGKFLLLYILFFYLRTENKFCCDLKMIIEMKDLIDLYTGIFSRCPTCVINFSEVICEYTCSPNNYDFLEEKEIVSDSTGSRFYKLTCTIYGFFFNTLFYRAVYLRSKRICE